MNTPDLALRSVEQPAKWGPPAPVPVFHDPDSWNPWDAENSDRQPMNLLLALPLPMNHPSEPAPSDRQSIHVESVTLHVKPIPPAWWTVRWVPRTVLAPDPVDAIPLPAIACTRMFVSVVSRHAFWSCMPSPDAPSVPSMTTSRMVTWLVALRVTAAADEKPDTSFITDTPVTGTAAFSGGADVPSSVPDVGMVMF